MLDFINTATDTNKGKGWNYSKRKCEPVFKNCTTVNQPPRAHHEGYGWSEPAATNAPLEGGHSRRIGDEPRTHPPLPKVFGFSLFSAPKFFPPTYLPPTSSHSALTPSSELGRA